MRLDSRRLLFAAGLVCVFSGAAGAAERTERAPASSRAASSTAAGSCILIRTPEDLNRVRYNLTGSFCLANDIDLAFSEFVPIGDARRPFLGTFDGGGHTIRNFLMASAARNVGLFGVVGNSNTTNGSRGIVRNLSVESGRIEAYIQGANVGVLAGLIAASAQVTNVRSVSRFLDGLATIGGLAGRNEGTIRNAESITWYDAYTSSDIGGGLVGENYGQISYSHSRSRMLSGESIGGLVGINHGTIYRSYAVGDVGVFDDWGPITDVAGGLVGENRTGGRVLQSFATGRINGRAYWAGGLVGRNADGATIAYSYAGTQRGSRLEVEACGNLAGVSSGAVVASYAAGELGCPWGGLIGDADSESSTVRSYWDREQTGSEYSEGGIALTTAQLQAQLPAGFSPQLWGITPNLSYPFLEHVGFKSPLATRKYDGRLLFFLPISQMDTWRYREPVVHQAQASKATVFTMIANAHGIKDPHSWYDLRIDIYFWEDTIQQSYWRGPITDRAGLGRLTSVGAQDSLLNSDLVRALGQNRVVVVRGGYDGEAGLAQHWMLATSYSVDSAGAVKRIFANDPWTGKQVQIDPTSRTVVAPAGFPLRNWRLNAYQVVSFKQPPEDF